MKFNDGDILYYVCPFLFTIHKVKVEMAVKEKNNLYYITSSGAYLQEHDLFKNLQDARGEACIRLDNFFYEKRYEIINNTPKLEEDY